MCKILLCSASKSEVGAKSDQVIKLNLTRFASGFLLHQNVWKVLYYKILLYRASKSEVGAKSDKLSNSIWHAFGRGR